MKVQPNGVVQSQGRVLGGRVLKGIAFVMGLGYPAYPPNGGPHPHATLVIYSNKKNRGAIH